MLSFPPHCSHELQPLDKTVYGPFKAYFNQAAQSWLKDPLNIGRRISIHQMPKLIKHAFEKAVVPHNIISGFAATGIYPFSRDAIPDDRYLPSFTTDLPDPAHENTETATTENNDQAPSCSKNSDQAPSCSKNNDQEPSSSKNSDLAPSSSNNSDLAPSSSKNIDQAPPCTPSKNNNQVPSCSKNNDKPINSSFSPKSITTEQIRPFPKSLTRRDRGQGIKRKTVKSTIYTSRPVKRRMESERQEKRKTKTKEDIWHKS